MKLDLEAGESCCGWGAGGGSGLCMVAGGVCTCWGGDSGRGSLKAAGWDLCSPDSVSEADNLHMQRACKWVEDVSICLS